MEEGGRIWSDELHLTGGVHQVLAKNIVTTLLTLTILGGTEESPRIARRKRDSEEKDSEVRFPNGATVISPRLFGLFLP